MKKITFLLLIFVLTFTFSCDPDDDTPKTTYKLVKIEFFNPNNELSNSTSTFEYNDDGFVSKINFLSAEETAITEYIYSNGKIVATYYAEGSSTRYTYTGDLITSSVAEEDGIIYNSTTYTYNSNNQVISKVETRQGTEYETTYTYDSNDNVLSKTEVSNGDTYITDYTYDSKKNPVFLAFPNALIRTSLIGQNNVLSEGLDFSYTYEYNNNGYPTKVNDFFNGELQWYYLYTYEEI